MKIFNKTRVYKKREISLFDFPVLQYGKFIENNTAETFMDLFPEKSFEKRILDKILNTTGCDYDFICILRAGMGEAYLCALLFKDIMKKFGFKKPCFVCTRKEYESLCKMLLPDIPFYHIDIDPCELNSALRHRYIKYKNTLFNVNPSTWYELQTLLKNYETEKTYTHYAQVISDFNEAKTFYFNPVIDEKTKSTVKSKIKNLNTDNFVFIVPKTNFVEPLQNSFWNNLYIELTKKGYDFFVNDESLTIREAYYLAGISKGLVAVRGGFGEVLSTLNIPKHYIYTPCKFSNIKNMQKIFTITKYPYTDGNIFEYNAQTDEENDISDSILRRF